MAASYMMQFPNDEAIRSALRDLALHDGQLTVATNAVVSLIGHRRREAYTCVAEAYHARAPLRGLIDQQVEFMDLSELSAIIRAKTRD